MMKLTLSLLAFMTVFSCGKKNDFVFVGNGFENQVFSETPAIVGDGGKVDIIWVIDNSGSMSTIQQNVIANTDLFMQEFTKFNTLDWKMGLLSTSVGEQPYLGFATPFNSLDSDPVTTFQDAVNKLGTDGDATERTFDPVIKNLNLFKNFLRPEAYLIVIMVSDEPEQSQINAQKFVADLFNRKTDNKYVKIYGAFEAKEFGCGEYALNYNGSQYKKAIDATNGKVYSTCSPDFGSKLAEMGKEIVASITSTVIMLKKRPIPSSIKVTYNNALLPPGPYSEGGMWFYDAEVNGVRFYNLSFVDYNVKEINITYDVDQGQDQ